MRRLTPDNLVCALLFFLPFERLPSLPLWGVSLRPSLVVGAALIGLVAWRQPDSFKPNSVLKKALYGFLLVSLISAVMSAHVGRALEVGGFTVFVGLVALAVASTVSALDWARARTALLSGAILVVGLSLFQFGGDLVGLPMRVTGLKPAYSSQIFGFPRVQGASLEPLYLANYLLLPVAVVLGGMISLGAAAGLVALGVVVFLTLSRGGVAALGVLALVVVAAKLWRRQWRQAALGAAGLLVAAVLAVGALAYVVPVLTHYRQGRDKVVSVYTHQLTSYEIGNSGVDRAETRRLAVELWRTHPLLGAGPGTFGYYAHERNPKFPNRQIVNNEPLELLAETGVVGLVAFLIFALTLTLTAARSIWRQPMGAAWGWRLGLLAFLIAAGVQYWSFSTLYIVHIWVAIGLLTGLSRNAKVKA